MLVIAATWTQPAGAFTTVTPLSASDDTSTSPAAVPGGLAMSSDATAVELVVEAALWKIIDVGEAVCVVVTVGVGLGGGKDVQLVLKYAFMREMSKMSTKPSGVSGAIS